MKLYGFWRSSATWRVRIGLAYKGIAYDYQPVDLIKGGGEQHRADYVAINPMKQVPVLELDDGTRLTQSLPILEYLDEVHPEPPLLPRDPIPRARVRQIAEMINSGVQPLQNTAVRRHVEEVLHADGQAWIERWVATALTAIEAVVKEHAGKFAVGDSISLADVCIVPQLYFARRFDLAVERYPTLLRIESTCASMPAFASAHGERQIDFARPKG